MLHGFTFDPSISLGNVLTLLGAIVTLTIAWGKLGSRLALLEFRVVAIERTLDSIAKILDKFNTNEKELALLKQEEAALVTQVATLHATIEGLRRGEGFIQSPRRANVDGNYSRAD